MNFNDPEKQSRQIDIKSPSIKSRKISNRIVNHKQRQPHLFWSSCLLLSLICLMVILGVISMSPIRISSVTNFPHDILKTLNEIEPFSLRILCLRPKASNQEERTLDYEGVFGTLSQVNLESGRLPKEKIKRATSNGTNVSEELQTAPLNTPSTTATTTLILPTTEVSFTSFPVTTTLFAFPTTGQITSSSTELSSQPLSSVVTTVITQISSSRLSGSLLSGSSSGSSSGSPEVTTLTGRSSSNDISTSTSEISTSETSVPVITSIAQKTIYTTTLPNGGLSTLTSTTIIQTAVDQTSSVPATKTRPSAGLQTNIAQKIQNLPFGQLIGIVCIAVANVL